MDVVREAAALAHMDRYPRLQVWQGESAGPVTAVGRAEQREEGGVLVTIHVPEVRPRFVTLNTREPVTWGFAKSH